MPEHQPPRVKRALARWVREAVVRTGLDDRLARHTQGKSPRSLVARLAPPHTSYPAPSVRTVMRNGLEFELDVSDFMQWCAYYGIATEPRSTLYGLAQPGMCVLDVGTNVGETLLNLAGRVGPAGVVHGFEVNPSTFARCQRNVTRNRLQNIRLHQLGLGDAEGTLALERPTLRNTGGDRLRSASTSGEPGTKSAGDDQSGVVKVPVTTLDAFAEAQQLQRLDLLKVDVEGFEAKIVSGGSRTLRRLHPTLFFEVSDRLLRGYGSSARELVEALEALGYRLRHAETGAPVGPGYDFENSHFDVIGVVA